MKIKFLTEPALLLEPGKILVIADLHIGIEYEMFKAGIKLPSQTEKMTERIKKLIKDTKAKELIILGDVKHNIPGISWQETEEIPKFFEELSKKIKITVVKGNHDGDIDLLTGKAKIKIVQPSGFKMKNIGFAHGQAWFKKSMLDCDTILMAHVHPIIEFRSGTYRATEHCWLKGKVDNEILKKKFKKESKIREIIIMPVFNKLIGGYAVNSEEFQPLGPILKHRVMDIKKSEIYLLDGTYLGKLDKLKKKI